QAEASREPEEVGSRRLHRLLGRREEVQVAEAALDDPLRVDARPVWREVGPRFQLSDGGAELRAGAFAARQEDGAGPQAQGALTHHSWYRSRKKRRRYGAAFFF